MNKRRTTRTSTRPEGPPPAAPAAPARPHVPHQLFWSTYHKIADCVCKPRTALKPYFSEAEIEEHIALQNVVREVLEDLISSRILTVIDDSRENRTLRRYSPMYLLRRGVLIFSRDKQLREMDRLSCPPTKAS